MSRRGCCNWRRGRAVERSEFTVAYQPIISLADGLVIGFEALARWQDPKLGPISPAEFIPVAEENWTDLLAWRVDVT
jgi:sensor c-di-GMP phosphodiesterase-like protein